MNMYEKLNMCNYIDPLNLITGPLIFYHSVFCRNRCT